MNMHVDRIKTESFGITTYLDNLRRGQYQIPTFQREVVWDRDRIKRFWDSIFRFYPLGSILVWRTDTQLRNHRAIGGHVLPADQAIQEYCYLLDGQQRTTALLTSMYGGDSVGDDRSPVIYADLTVEDVDEVDDESWRERFLFWDEIDDRGGELIRNLGRQQRFDEGLIIKLGDVAHEYGKLERRLVKAGYEDFDDPIRDRLRRFRQVFDNYRLSFIELRGIEVAEVCQIFERVNQAGQPLSMFDIVVAKTYKPGSDGEREFYLRGLVDDFKKELKSSGSQYAQLDDMAFLRILAVLVRQHLPDAGIQNITSRYLNQLRTDHLEAIWSDGQQSIKRVFDFLGNHLGLPGPALVPYGYFYMSLAAYFFQNTAPDYDLLRKYFWYCSFHDEDLLSNTTHLRQHIDDFEHLKQTGEYTFGRFLIDKDQLRNATYSSRGRLSRAMLALFANQDPRDWAVPDKSVLRSVYYTLTDHPNLHHIFPLNFCEEHLSEAGRRYEDSLLNIAYLTQITNLRISDRNPLEYIGDFLGPRFGEIQSSHLLPNMVVDWAARSEMQDDGLDQFVNARLEIVLQRLRKLLPDIRFDVVDTGVEASEAAAVA